MASSALLLLLAAVLAAAAAAPAASAPSPASAAAEEDPLQKLAPAVLKVARECLSKEYNALACWKLFLVRRADGFIGDVRTSEVKHQGGAASFELLPGFVALEKDARRQDNEVLDDLEDVGGMEAKDEAEGQDLAEDSDLQDPGRDQESLDRALIARTNKLFSGRHVSVKVLPGVALKVSPRMGKDQSSVDADVSVEVGPGFSVGRMKMKNMSPVFLLPPLMFMGMMPFMLATLKGVVVKAMMLNQVAFMSTLFMTVRDTVFGPRPIVKYHNYGYKPPRPPVHFRHPAPPPPQVHHVEHQHHSEPVHFEHHHEEHHLPDHRVEHHVEHHETHGASPFFHDEASSGSAEDGFNEYSQDLAYQGADDRHDRTSHKQQQGHQGEVLDEEEEAAPLPQAAAYRRQPQQRPAQLQQQQQQQQYESRPNRLRYARTAAAAATAAATAAVKQN